MRIIDLSIITFIVGVVGMCAMAWAIVRGEVDE